MATAIATAAQSAASIFPPPVTEIRLEIFDRIPARHFAHAASDDSAAPLVRAGEVVVAEGDGSPGWIPVDGGLFVIEYASPPEVAGGHPRRRREIVQTRLMDWRGEERWAVAAYSSARNEAEHGRAMRSGGPIYMADFPCTFDRLVGMLIGRVVGIYNPAALRFDG